MSIVAKKIYIIMYLGVPVHSFVNEETAKKELAERNNKVGSGFTLETSYLQFPKDKNLEEFDFEVIGFED
ncbi:MAG: hypothetical protein ACRC8M_00285 [Cetobacterium sp.]|uniref:hypothetical protein n=1 Tax=Cetobacterium sp. TaxID=2071632 RepID=UPI003F2BB2C7